MGSMISLVLITVSLSGLTGLSSQEKVYSKIVICCKEIIYVKTETILFQKKMTDDRRSSFWVGV